MLVACTPSQSDFVTAAVANSVGEIFELEGYAAVGMAGNTHVALLLDHTRNTPFGSELRAPGRTSEIVCAI